MYDVYNQSSDKTGVFASNLVDRAPVPFTHARLDRGLHLRFDYLSDFEGHAELARRFQHQCDVLQATRHGEPSLTGKVTRPQLAGIHFEGWMAHSVLKKILKHIEIGTRLVGECVNFAEYLDKRDGRIVDAELQCIRCTVLFADIDNLFRIGPA